MTGEAMKRIDQFRERWAFLSNFHPGPLIWQGIEYPTSEHAFNAGKTTDTFLRRWIASANAPKEAKRRGHLVRLRDDWDAKVRYEVMGEVLRAKFTAHPGRSQALLGTGDALLVEGTTWHDTHWGICTCSKHKGEGLNHLGRMLMELREELRS